MKRAWTALLALALLTAPASAEAKFEGTVVAGEAFAVWAEYGGRVSEVSAEAGDLVSVGEALMALETTKVFATRDGTVAKVFAEAGEDATEATEDYGSAIAVAPVNKYTIYMTVDGAYDSATTKRIQMGETLYLKCTKNGTHRGVGIVTEVDNDEYTILCTGGSFSNGETIYAYRDSAYASRQRVGEGTVIATDVDLYAADGTVVKCHVADGDEVERGQLLMEVAGGAPTDEGWNGGRVGAETGGIVLCVLASAGDSVSQGQAVATLCRADGLEIAFAVPEAELSEVQEGARATVELPGTHEAYEGTVERMLYSAEEGEAAYMAYVRLTAGAETLAIGRNVTVRVGDPQ
ncbi:MAG: HlyD family efflux transporter periplasmic adaptor subunit [Clostridiales bacterium]|jgi:biotin carboxyl carrier protein|nr:HlyD family efflux transporter periplasmic adaptor subunit [Clostridiales bacterium]OPZ67942.1 MAG: dihydrolipoamide acetyltransferase [Firmicutes bacterium ADurb.Bin467]